MRLVHRLAAWLDAGQLIGYGVRFSDKAFLAWYCLLRVAFLPLRLVSARLYQKAPFLFGLVPTVTIAAPYGTFRARAAVLTCCTCFRTTKLQSVPRLRAKKETFSSTSARALAGTALRSRGNSRMPRYRA
jgi:hypothetical protein